VIEFAKARHGNSAFDRWLFWLRVQCWRHSLRHCAPDRAFSVVSRKLVTLTSLSTILLAMISKTIMRVFTRF